MRTNYAVRVFAPQPVKLHLADERSGALGHLDGPSICCFRCPRHCRCSSARRLVAFAAGIFKSVAMWCVSDEPRAHAVNLSGGCCLGTRSLAVWSPRKALGRVRFAEGQVRRVSSCLTFPE